MSNLNTNRVKKNHKELPISELLITMKDKQYLGIINLVRTYNFREN